MCISSNNLCLYLVVCRDLIPHSVEAGWFSPALASLAAANRARANSILDLGRSVPSLYSVRSSIPLALRVHSPRRRLKRSMDQFRQTARPKKESRRAISFWESSCAMRSLTKKMSLVADQRASTTRDPLLFRASSIKWPWKRVVSCRRI